MTRRWALFAVMMVGFIAVFVVPARPAAAAGADSLPPPPPGICSRCTPVGYHAFGPVPDFAGDPYWRNHGQCTWWVEVQRTDKNWNQHLGYYAYQWAAGARRLGWAVGTTPAVGAAIVFQPWIQGAWGGGHIALVLTVYSGNYWLLIQEMNFYAHGGGWDRVSYRYVHLGPGVSFIY